MRRYDKKILKNVTNKEDNAIKFRYKGKNLESYITTSRVIFNPRLLIYQ